MDIIDAHANLGSDASNLRNNLIPIEQSASQLLAKMDYHNVSKAIIVPFPSPAAQFNKSVPWYDLENHYLIDAASDSKRLTPFPGVNPNDSRSIDNIQKLAVSFGIRGIKLSHQIPMKFSVDRLIKNPLMKIVRDNDLIFMIHTGSGKEKGAGRIHTTLDHAIGVARAYPDINFIFCHLGRIHESIPNLLNMENAFMDTAGMSIKPWDAFVALKNNMEFSHFASAGIIEKLVDFGFGKKIVWGSDEPYTQYKNEINCVKNAEITGSKKRAIFHDNIAGLLRLK